METTYVIVYSVPPGGGARVAEVWFGGRKVCAVPSDINQELFDEMIEYANSGLWHENHGEQAK